MQTENETTNVQPMTATVIERISDGDKALLDNSKTKRELALANAKTALAQSELAEAQHQNIILQLAMRYGLVDGDVISETGEIQRKSSRASQ